MCRHTIYIYILPFIFFYNLMCLSAQIKYADTPLTELIFSLEVSLCYAPPSFLWTVRKVIHFEENNIMKTINICICSIREYDTEENPMRIGCDMFTSYNNTLNLWFSFLSQCCKIDFVNFKAWKLQKSSFLRKK